MSINENIYVSQTWGRTVFRESPKNWSPIKTCAHCILRGSEDCYHATCTPDFRSDGRDGYFTVQDWPAPQKP